MGWYVVTVLVSLPFGLSAGYLAKQTMRLNAERRRYR
jgi:hypothetical protein